MRNKKQCLNLYCLHWDSYLLKKFENKKERVDKKITKQIESFSTTSF